MERDKRHFAVSLMIGVENMENLEVQLPKDIQEATLKMIHTVLTTAVKDIEKQKSFPPYMTKQEASKYLHISGTTFDKWQCKLNIPLIQIEGVKRYKRETLDEFMKNIEQQNTK
ncbi:DNA-binding protein [Limosilactobacillus vaginalis]|nr:DNA-binding protein [Limosilactobacillus vaginalis]